MPWKCFLTEPSEFAQRDLRRYASKSECTGKMSYHNEAVVIDPKVPIAFNKEGGFLKDDYEGDPRWPTHCACGYKFKEDDKWQVNVDRLYQGSPDGEIYTLRGLPIGAMWDAHWFDHDRYRGPDKKAWCIRMPATQDWIVYGPSSNGSPWDVQGKPPLITVKPSIGIRGHYHGFIKGGIITEDVDGRKYPGIPRTA